MSGTLQASVVKDSASATDNLALDSSGNVTVGSNLLVGTTSTGANGIAISNNGGNYSVAEGSGTSIFNLFRQRSSAATVLANGYKYSATVNGFASSTGIAWPKCAISLSSGHVLFYADTSTTVANGTDVTPTERMRIDTSGNLLVGTTTSNGKLTVSQSSSAATGVYIAQPVGTVASQPTVRALGYSPAYELLNKDSTQNWYFGINDNDSKKLYIGKGYGPNQGIAPSICIDTSDNVLVGTTAVGNNTSGVEIRPTVGGNAHPRIEVNKTFSGSATLQSFQYNKTEIGRITCDNTTTAYVTSSDYRLKKDIVYLTGSLDKVIALKPSTYRWKEDDSVGEGFIAHELQSVIPLAVFGEKDAVDDEGKPIHQGVDYSKIVVHLVAALQEAVDKITALEDRITKLESVK